MYYHSKLYECLVSTAYSSSRHYYSIFEKFKKKNLKNDYMSTINLTTTLRDLQLVSYKNGKQVLILGRK